MADAVVQLELLIFDALKVMILDVGYERGLEMDLQQYWKTNQ